MSDNSLHYSLLQYNYLPLVHLCCYLGDRKGIWPYRLSSSEPKVVEWVGHSPKYPTCLLHKTFGLSCESAKDKDDWRLRIKGQLADRGLPG